LGGCEGSGAGGACEAGGGVGDAAGARELYHSFARRLAEELDTQPSADTRRLIEDLDALSGEEAAGEAAPDARTPAAGAAAPGTQPAGATARPSPDARPPVPTPPAAASPAGPGRLLRTVRRGRGLPAYVGALLIVLLVAGTYWWSMSAELSFEPPLIDRPVLGIVPFEDFTPGDEFAHLAGAISNALLVHFAEIPGIEVVSITPDQAAQGGDALARFAGRTRDQMVIVRGSLTRSEGRLRVDVRLAGPTGRTLGAGTVLRPMSEVFDLVDDVAREVGALRQRQLGREIQVRRRQSGTDNVQAWELVQRAEQLRERSRRLRGLGSPDAARAGLARADSLLRVAATLAPDWIEPALLSARVSEDAGWLAFMPPIADSLRAREWFRDAYERVDRVIMKKPSHASALELRGTLAYWISATSRPQDVLADSMLRIAEEDLRRAVSVDGSRVKAWSLLSDLQFRRAQFSELVHVHGSR
jgi:TolB-like protein